MNDICCICGAEAIFITLASWRCAEHRDITVVAPVPEKDPGRQPTMCYYTCGDGVHTCQK